MTDVVLGIDPQSSRLGLALVELAAPHRALWADTVSIDRKDGGWQYEQVTEALDLRIYSLENGQHMARIGIEEPPYVNNHRVYRGISVVFGLVGAECHRRWPDAPQISCGVGTWKKAVLGKGTASKDDVMAWADGAYTFKVDGDPPSLAQDSADALAIATYAAQVELREAA